MKKLTNIYDPMKLLPEVYRMNHDMIHHMRKYVRQAVKEGYDDEFILFTGSRAVGCHTEESDYDYLWDVDFDYEDKKINDLMRQIKEKIVNKDFLPQYTNLDFPVLGFKYDIEKPDKKNERDENKGLFDIGASNAHPDDIDAQLRLDRIHMQGIERRVNYLFGETDVCAAWEFATCEMEDCFQRSRNVFDAACHSKDARTILFERLVECYMYGEEK